ncbi:MAG: dsDNA nuclease domain-containing protein [Bacteroidota bacterium]
MNLTDLYKSVLHSIAEKRTGGQIAIEGFFYQFQYSLCNLLESLSDDKVQGIRLEGIEDLDVFEHYEGNKFIRKFYQVKHSKNSLSPSQFWGKGIIQNFLEVYTKDRNAHFVVVHDMDIKGDYLIQIKNQTLDDKGLEYWQKKIIEFQKQQKETASKAWGTSDIQSFLQSISFQKISGHQLQKNSLKEIIQLFSIDTGNANLFYKSLLQQTLEWSLNREFITFAKLQNVVKRIQSEIEKGGINKAAKQGWISEVEFIPGEKANLSKYYEGIAARPAHIANGLPVRRKSWEKELEISLSQADISVIKASSGQGKSTIGWQTAYHLKQKGHTIYELILCDVPEKIGELLSFLETRYKYLGEYPIVIIDGLNQLQKSWNLLANRLADAPVKFLITTREEDWRVFGGGFSILDVRFINLNMSFTEAKDIFNVLKKNKIVHESAPKWQAAWESVEERGLMMEYIFLITQGRMLHSRLREQVISLNDPDSSVDGAAKLEILRLVSLADLCGIKLKTDDVITLVRRIVGIKTDRGRLIKSLENEYYIKFGANYVEGLHSVRSHHLFELLHEHISPIETATNLVSVITDNQIQLFFSNVFSFLNSENFESFISFCGVYFSSKSYFEKSEVCNGLFEYEVRKHWEENQEHYDKIFELGGIQLCPIETAPWQEKRLVEKMNTTLKGLLNHLIEEIAKVEKFDPEKSMLSAFLRTLQNDELKTNLRGLGALSQWYLKLKIPYKIYDGFPFDSIINLISDGEVEEAANIADALYLYNQDVYVSFINLKKCEVFPVLKKQTQTLSLQEKGGDIKIQYLLLGEKIAKGNDESVNRINIISSILPIYEKYCTRALIPPLELYDYLNWDSIDSSVKNMPKENIYNKFQVHLNQMWVSGIQSFYSSGSFYEWQEQWVDMRRLGLKYVMTLNAVIEAFLEGNSARANKQAKAIEKISKKLIHLIRTERKIPDIQNYDFIQEIKNIEKLLVSWKSKLLNIVNQTVSLFDKENTQTNINVIGIYRIIEEMQTAFDSIGSYQAKYFSTKELSGKEVYWYGRLFNSVQYLTECFDQRKPVNNAKDQIADWAYSKKNLFDKSVISAISFLEQETGFESIYPSFSLYDELLTTVVIGIKGIELAELEDKFVWLCVGLQEFANVKLDFLTVVLVKENIAKGAWRFNKKTLSQLKEMTESDNFDETTFNNPLPISLDERTISPLEGIQLNPITLNSTENVVYELFENLWTLSRYREKLDTSIDAELSWLAEIESEYKLKTKENLSLIEKEYPSKDFDYYSGLTARIIEEGKLMTNQEFTLYTNALFKQILMNI